MLSAEWISESSSFVNSPFWVCIQEMVNMLSAQIVYKIFFILSYSNEATSATVAPTNSIKETGDISSCRPRTPALTKMVSKEGAVE